MERRLTVIGCIMWIIGLAVSIIGLNLTGTARTWVSIAGNAVFLVGLGITGAVWFKKKQADKNK